MIHSLKRLKSRRKCDECDFQSVCFTRIMRTLNADGTRPRHVLINCSFHFHGSSLLLVAETVATADSLPLQSNGDVTASDWSEIPSLLPDRAPLSSRGLSLAIQERWLLLASYTWSSSCFFLWTLKRR